MLKTTTPWYCGVFSVIRASPLFSTLLPYRNDCSAAGLSQTLYYKAKDGAFMSTRAERNRGQRENEDRETKKDGETKAGRVCKHREREKKKVAMAKGKIIKNTQGEKKKMARAKGVRNRREKARAKGEENRKRERGASRWADHLKEKKEARAVVK